MLIAKMNLVPCGTRLGKYRNIFIWVIFVCNLGVRDVV